MHIQTTKIIVLEVNLLFVFKSDEMNMIRSELRSSWLMKPQLSLGLPRGPFPWAVIAEVCDISRKTKGVLGSELTVRSAQPRTLHMYLFCSSLGGKGIKGTVFTFTGVTGLLFSSGCLVYNIGRCFTHVFYLIVFLLLVECLDLRITCLLWRLL